VNSTPAARIQDLLEASAHKWPSNIALDFGGQTISYDELNALSLEIADLLKTRIPSSSFRAAIHMPKSIESVILIFGILKAGGTYIPLDWEAPIQRNLYILKDCEVSILFSSKNQGSTLADNFTSLSTENISIGPLEVRMSLLNTQQKPSPYPEDIAYILYTSGSTGKPKGVVFTHTNALSFINWCTECFEPDENSVFSSHAPFHFDLSILDLYVSIKHGALLILMDSFTGKNPRALSHLIQEKKITHWYSTPTILKLMLHYGKIDRHDHSSLKFVLFAGEVFPVEPLRKLTEFWPQARFFNLYGPTETNVCTYFEIPLPIELERSHPFPIGKTCSHLQSKLHSISSSEVELCISGPAVCQGYWKGKSKTALSLKEEGGIRWYHTGDLVTTDAKGNFVYVGRKDRMVKKNGFRIEPGEIENVLHLHRGVRDAAVLASHNFDFECQLVAFIEGEKTECLNESVLKTFCQENLPHYMTPDQIIFLTSIPKTSTDKTDYQQFKKNVR
jgi:amino acid adenylation domain-containing protein